VVQAQVDGRSSNASGGPKSTSLSIEDEAAVIAFRRHTLLQLDDCLYVHASVPNLTRSSLHRCVQRHGISRLQLRSQAQDPKGLTPYDAIVAAW
jgi:hypothetical protein